MVDQKLQSYLVRVKQEGMSPQEARAVLLKAGWNADDVSEAIMQNFGQVVKPGVEVSKFEQMRRWLLVIIGLRVALFPIRYFLAPLQLTPEAFSKYAKLPIFGSVGWLGAILPIFWLFPFWGIMRREKSSYLISIVFGILLIYVNIFTITQIVASGLFLVLSVVYFVTGTVIIYLAAKSLHYFPGNEEQPSRETTIKESSVGTVKVVIALVFGFTVTLPGVLFRPAGFNFSWVMVAIAFALGAASGWVCAENMVKAIREGRGLGAFALLHGFLNGATAQLALYGLNPILAIAAPVGGFIGIVLGLIGMLIIFSLTKATIIKR